MAHNDENKPVSLNGNGSTQLDSARLPENGRAASDGSMQAAFDAGIRPKLNAIDKVRHHLKGVNIELPAIVVVGDQSSGKSSVLESISGIALPRGGNLVTRCPLQLGLRRGPTGHAGKSAKLSFTNPDPEDSSHQVCWDLRLDEIAEKVQEATNMLAGTKSGLVPALISLQVTTPDAPDLTLIDLPGIARVPIGDQPGDIEDQIKDLIHHHIQGLNLHHSATHVYVLANFMVDLKSPSLLRQIAIITCKLRTVGVLLLDLQLLPPSNTSHSTSA